MENNLNFIAKKSLGQNFLHAPQVIGAMVHAGNVSAGDTVVEVGPGKGVLTSALLETGAHVISIEKDDRAIPFLNDKFSQEIKSGKLKLIHGDVLEMDAATIGVTGEKYKIIANIPYYISGEFLRKFLESDAQPQLIVVMLQKELAKRIVDTKGSILSISIKAYGEPKYVVSVPRKFFRPMPNVDSAVVLIQNISKSFFLGRKDEKSSDIAENMPQIQERAFFEVLKAGFAHKRKVLIKNLEEKIDSETLKGLWQEEGWSLTIRAEELSLENWKKIALLSKKVNVAE